MLGLYAFLVHFGTVFRFTDVESAAGTSTILAVLVIVLAGIRGCQAAIRINVYQTLLGLIFWIGLVSAPLARGASQINSLVQVATMIGYVLFAAAVSVTVRSERWASRIIFFLGLGLAIASFLTIVDYLGIIDVPGNK